MKKNCELCRKTARMYCESDQASLCWTCDFKVHAANFLVARHLRTLLCHVCQSPTPWSAAGTKLGPTVSVCDNCVRKGNHLEGEEEAEEEEEVDCNESEGEDDDDEDEEDNEESQVVPWSPTAPPPLASSSSDEIEEEERYSASSSSSEIDRKRMRKNASDLRSNGKRCCFDLNQPPETAEEEVGRGGGDGGAGGGPVDFVDSSLTMNLKRRRGNSGRVGILVESVKRLHRQEMGSPAALAELRRLSADQSPAVDCDSSKCS